MARSKKIYHRNDARPALSNLKLSSRRILWLTLAQQEKDDSGKIVFNPERLYVITAKEYATLCDIDESVAYRQLREGIRDIRSYLMEVPESEILSEDEMEGKAKGRTLLFTVAKHGVYSDGEGYVELKLDPIIAPYISKLKSKFTGQFLLSALRIPDTNANRFYLLLREWISSGMFFYNEISVEELKKQLGVDNVKTYVAFKDFNKLFICRAINKIIQTTEFTKIEMEIIERRQRKAYMLKISFEYEEQMRDLKNSKFQLGAEKKSKKKSDAKIMLKNNSKDKSEKMKQIVGRFHTKQSAEASGYNWDDY